MGNINPANTKVKMKEQNPIAMPVVSGYSMIMYCQYCMKHKEIALDGPRCYEKSRRNARRNGWTLHKNGFCTCPDCKR